MLTPEELEIAEATKVVWQAGYVAPVDHARKLKALIAQGWRTTYAELFGQSFVDSLDSAETDDKHHSEAIEWHWNARVALLEGGRPPHDWFAYFPIWPRGNMKTTIAEHMVVMDAVLSVAYVQPGFCLYIGREKDKVKENISNIETILSSKKVREYAPKLSDVKRNDETGQKRQWTGTFLHTAARYVIKAATVESAQAGSKIEGTRVTFFLPDDIDSRDESPVIAETKFRLLTSEILPMRQQNTLTFFAQNLINRYSTMYRIHTGKSAVLANRKPTEPIPAVRDLVTERRTIDGQIRDIMVAGKPTWRVWDRQRVQDEIDTYTLPVFLTECQHEVEQNRDGVLLYEYDDKVHVISESEFISVYGSLDIWLQWRKKPGNDWARTKTDKHANVAGWLTKSDSASALPNHTFLIYPLSFPGRSSPEDVAERLISCLSPYAYEKVTWRQLRHDVLRRANADVHTKNDAEKIQYEHGELARIIPNYTKPLLQRCNVQSGEMSHEVDTIRKTYAYVYALGLRPKNPGKHGGIETINTEMRIDKNEAHPFRPGEMGYSQWHFIVPDDTSRPYREVNGQTVYHPRPYPLAFQTDALEDSDLWRFHITNWRDRPAKLTVAGEAIDEPEKLYDDACNLLQMWYTGAPLKGTSLTFEQQVELIIPASVKEMGRLAVTGEEKLVYTMTREFEETIAKQALNPEYIDDEIGDVSEWQ